MEDIKECDENPNETHIRTLINYTNSTVD
jgi:hypothetical protein